MVTELNGRAVDLSTNDGHGRALFHALPIPESGLPFSPFQIVSLLDVIRYYAFDHLDSFKKFFDESQKISGLSHAHGSQHRLSDTHLAEFLTTVRQYESECERAKFKRPLKRLANLKQIEIYPADFPYERVKWEMKEIIDATIEEWKNKKFFIADESKVYLYKLRSPFGAAVYDAFPSARANIREAANCYVLDRSTACVFSLTRVLELGLFVLAQDNNLFGMTSPPIPIGVRDPLLETWETLINKIESAITNIQKASIPKSVRVSTLDLYSGAAIHFRYFKDHWRNPISHSRSYYDERQASSALKRVEEFMRYLAVEIKLSEQPGMILP